MEISRKTDYALRMMAALVREPGLLSVRQAADNNDIPYSFARAIQHDLVKAGLIESLRGSRGGMRVAVDPQTTTLLQIVEAVQGPVHVGDCATSGPDGGPCQRIEYCCYNPIWRGACMMLNDYLNSVTLSEIVEGSKMPSLPQKYWSEDAFEKLCYKTHE